MIPIRTQAGLRRFIRIWRRKTTVLSRTKLIGSSVVATASPVGCSGSWSARVAGSVRGLRVAQRSGR